jgi:hypothetical protein
MLEDEVAEALARLEAFDPDDTAVTVDRERTDMRRIGAALYAVDYAHTTLVRAVANARRHGRSWTDIANVLGVSRQAARQRFSDQVDALTDLNAADPAVQKLLDVGFTAGELEELATLLGFALVVGEAGRSGPVARVQMSEEKHRALQEFITTLSPAASEHAVIGTEPHRVG